MAEQPFEQKLLEAIKFFGLQEDSKLTETYVRDMRKTLRLKLHTDKTGLDGPRDHLTFCAIDPHYDLLMAEIRSGREYYSDVWNVASGRYERAVAQGPSAQQARYVSCEEFTTTRTWVPRQRRDGSWTVDAIITKLSAAAHTHVEFRAAGGSAAGGSAAVGSFLEAHGGWSSSSSSSSDGAAGGSAQDASAGSAQDNTSRVRAQKEAGAQTQAAQDPRTGEESAAPERIRMSSPGHPEMIPVYKARALARVAFDLQREVVEAVAEKLTMETAVEAWMEADHPPAVDASGQDATHNADDELDANMIRLRVAAARHVRALAEFQHGAMGDTFDRALVESLEDVGELVQEWRQQDEEQKSEQRRSVFRAFVVEHLQESPREEAPEAPEPITISSDDDTAAGATMVDGEGAGSSSAPQQRRSRQVANDAALARQVQKELDKDARRKRESGKAAASNSPDASVSGVDSADPRAGCRVKKVSRVLTPPADAPLTQEQSPEPSPEQSPEPCMSARGRTVKPTNRYKPYKPPSRK